MVALVRTACAVAALVAFGGCSPASVDAPSASDSALSEPALPDIAAGPAKSTPGSSARDSFVASRTAAASPDRDESRPAGISASLEAGRAAAGSAEGPQVATTNPVDPGDPDEAPDGNSVTATDSPALSPTEGDPLAGTSPPAIDPAAQLEATIREKQSRLLEIISEMPAPSAEGAEGAEASAGASGPESTQPSSKQPADRASDELRRIASELPELQRELARLRQVGDRSGWRTAPQ